MYVVVAPNFDQWRKNARELLKRNVSPHLVTWEQEKQKSLIGDMGEDFLSLEIRLPHPNISRDFFQLAKIVSCYRDSNRWALLYSVAWRLIYEDKRLLQFKVDPQILRFYSMYKAVCRDRHKMEAFVRFRLVSTPDLDGEYFVAWFEPDHFILPITAPFFMKRFNNMHWSILTPDACVQWNQEEMLYSKGVSEAPRLEDELESLWRDYYANIFNPARLKLKAMQSEMPKKYWVNLPESSLIDELTRNAVNRTESMIEKTSTESWSKTSKSSFVKDKQKLLRHR